MARPNIVRARINASGHRLIGDVELPEGQYRISDVLNGSNRYVMVVQGDVFQAVSIDGISYVVGIEEPDRPASLRRPGAFHAVTVELRDLKSSLTAECFVPEGSSLVEVLDSSARFQNLRTVEFVGSRERYEHLAVHKGQMTIVRVGD